MTTATFTDNQNYEIGQEIAGVPLNVSDDGLTSDMARVRITKILNRETKTIYNGSQLTWTTYECEVLHSRKSGVPAASNAISQHLANLAGGN